ncbi:uncharacterized protein JCM10292_003421 [Rhodotorula paludigena]|uniref:uncharacterized protein n=1 Tax=Rhodotorula paludigena TaxID=86838 RepID=UPI00317996C9
MASRGAPVLSPALSMASSNNVNDELQFDSEAVDETLDDSYFSSRPASEAANLEPDLLEPEPSFSSASSDTSTPDSLANADYAEVEARALDFLSASPPSTRPSPGFRLEDLPRPLPTSTRDCTAAQRTAIEYLKHALDDAERDDWRYRTPTVFDGSASRQIIGASASRDASQMNATLAGGLSADATWQDHAFNIESYAVEGLGRAFDDLPVHATQLSDANEWNGRFGEDAIGNMT